ncbi:MAG: hypothetical protein ACKOZT_02085 [Cyanobium sp.]
MPRSLPPHSWGDPEAAATPFAASRRRPRHPLGVLLLLGCGVLALRPAAAQQTGYGQTLGGTATPQERQLFGAGSTGAGGTALDAKNPLDLINQLRRSSSLDDATPPGTAIDRALRDLEATTKPAAGMPSVSPLASPGGSLKGP